MQNFLSNGGFAKMMSTIIQSIFVLGIGVILFLEAYHNQPFNAYLLAFLGVILGHQATVLTGVQSQGDLVNALAQGFTPPTVEATIPSPTPTDPQATQPKLPTVQTGAPSNG